MLLLGRREVFNEEEFRNDVIRLGGEALKQGKGGDPDRLCWLPHPNGYIVWFWAEWKRKGKMVSGLQYNQVTRINQLRKLGHTVYVFDDNDHARRIMRGLIGAI